MLEVLKSFVSGKNLGRSRIGKLKLNSKKRKRAPKTSVPNLFTKEIDPS